MAESFPIEPQLFQLYGAVFEALLKGLLVSVAMLFAAAIILIILCCREAVRQGRQKHPELPVGQASSRGSLRSTFRDGEAAIGSLGCRDEAVQ